MIVIGLITWKVERVQLNLCFFMKSSTFTWNSKRNKLLWLFFTCEEEFIASPLVFCYVMWLGSLFEELNLPQKGPTKIYVDNKFANALARNPMFHDGSKHIDARYHFDWEHIFKKEVELIYVKTCDHVVDIFTKSLKFEYFQRRSGTKKKIRD